MDNRINSNAWLNACSPQTTPSWKTCSNGPWTEMQKMFADCLSGYQKRAAVERGKRCSTAYEGC